MSTFPYKKTHPNLEDATEPLIFEVTKQDCKGAVVGDPNKCGGARAILRQIAGAVDSWVKRSVTVIEYNDGRILRYRNSKSVQTAVESFDETAGLFPVGTYQLLPPPPSQKSGLRQNRAGAFGDKKSKDRTKAIRKRPTHALR